MAATKPPTSNELLIRLDEKVSGKGGLIDVMNEMKTAVANQQASLDARVIVLETWKQTKAADETIHRWNAAAEFTEKVREDYPDIQATVDWHKAIKTNWKLITVVSGLLITIVSPVLGWLITQVVWPAIRNAL